MHADDCSPAAHEGAGKHTWGFSGACEKRTAHDSMSAERQCFHNVAAILHTPVCYDRHARLPGYSTDVVDG